MLLFCPGPESQCNAEQRASGCCFSCLFFRRHHRTFLNPQRRAFSPHMQDLSDIQWREFRAGLPALAALFAAAAAASRLLQRLGASPAARARLYLLISLAFLGALGVRV